MMALTVQSLIKHSLLYHVPGLSFSRHQELQQGIKMVYFGLLQAQTLRYSGDTTSDKTTSVAAEGCVRIEVLGWTWAQAWG